VQIEGAVPDGSNWNGGDKFTAVAGTTHNLTDDYVPVGSHSFHVDSTAGLKVGDSVIVHRPSTAAWIHDIGMDGPTDPWLPGSENMDSDRVITQMDGNLITIDAPLTDALEQKYGGGTIFKYSFPGRIDHVGVENLRGESAFDSSVTDKDGHAVDEKHAWTFISLAGVENAWVRQITAQYFAFSAVDVQKMSKWVTVTDCQSLDPVSQIRGGLRDSFELGGQLTLMKNCYSEHGRHDFILHSALPGPNVFLDCVAKESFDESGPHLHWDTGVLYDHVQDQGTTEKGHPFGGSLEARNRNVVDGSLQGWTGANLLFWNCIADQMDVEQPPTAQNWAIGCTARFTPTSNGFLESNNHQVEPHSLYHAQLEDRLGRQFGVIGQVRAAGKDVSGRRTDFSVTITNISAKSISGPILIALTSLPPGVRLASVSGYTTAGDAFVFASLTGLAPGQSVTTLVRFTAPLPSHGVGAEILAGLPQPVPAGPQTPIAMPAPANTLVSADAEDPSLWFTDLAPDLAPLRRG
jgi:hypothetical protein